MDNYSFHIKSWFFVLYKSWGEVTKYLVTIQDLVPVQWKEGWKSVQGGHVTHPGTGLSRPPCVLCRIAQLWLPSLILSCYQNARHINIKNPYSFGLELTWIWEMAGLLILFNHPLMLSKHDIQQNFLSFFLSFLQHIEKSLCQCFSCKIVLYSQTYPLDFLRGGIMIFVKNELSCEWRVVRGGKWLWEVVYKNSQAAGVSPSAIVFKCNAGSLVVLPATTQFSLFHELFVL